jgi:hypothetical protein
MLMRMGSMGWAMMAAMLLLQAALPLPAADGTGITISVDPEQLCAGSTVTVSGSTVPDRDNWTVTLVYRPPTGPPVTRTCQLDADHRYQDTFGPLEAVGQWRVEAVGPLGQNLTGRATGQFEVVPPATAAAVSVSGFQEAVATSAGFVGEAITVTTGFTELPQKDAALDRMDELSGVLDGMVSGWAEIGAALDRIKGSIDALAPFPEAQELMADLESRLQGPLANVREAEQQLHLTREEANSAKYWCRVWHCQKIGFKFVGKTVVEAYLGAKSLAEWAENKLVGVVTGIRDKLVAEAASDIASLTPEQITAAQNALKDIQFAETVIKAKVDPEANLGALKKDLADKAVDYLVNWIYAQVAHNCRMYDAKAKGTFYCEYYTKKMVYMTAYYTWEGKIELFFRERRSPTDIVRFEGQIWGSFGWQTGEFWPERTAMDIPGVTGIGICVPRPPFVDYRDFSIRLEGEGKPHSVEVEIAGTSYDIPRLKMMYIAVLWSPYQLVPSVDFPEMDVPGGQWFVTRVTGATGDEATFEIPLTVDGDDVLMRHVFKRTMDYVDEAEFEAELTLEIDGKESDI